MNGTGLFAEVERTRRLIVDDGVPKAKIVIAEKPSRTTKLAARELQSYVAKISGATLPIGSKSDDRYPVTIYVGRGEETEALGVNCRNLKHGAFKMVSGDDWLALVGDDTAFSPPEPWPRHRNDHDRVMRQWDEMTGGTFDNPIVGHYPLWKMRNAKMDLWQLDGIGSLNAVHEFLRDLGVRWYFPGEIGECVPKTPTIELPDVNETIEPDFPVRDLHQGCKQFFSADEDEIMWQLRMGLDMGYDLWGPKPHGHGMVPAHSRDVVRETHPEYFALWGGRRMTDREGKPCLSSPELFKRHVDYVRAVFDVYDFPVVNISPADGYATLCQCPLCRDKGNPKRVYHGKMSDYVWTYLNDVAKEVLKTHPNKKVSALAYSAYGLPPENIEKLSPNLVVVLAPGRSTSLGEDREEFLRHYNDWLDKSTNKEIYAWEYYLHARRGRCFEGVPVYFHHDVARHLRWLKGALKGEFIEVARFGDESEQHSLASNHLNLYVTSRMYWDADQDVDQLLDEYFNRFYGPAAGKMKEFVAFMEEHWREATKDVAVIDRIERLLDEAKALAGDTVCGERVELLRNYVKPLRQLRKQLAQRSDDVPRYDVHPRDEGTIKLDGKLDESAWGGISTPLKEARAGTGELAAKTYFRILWIGDSLYVGIRCEEPDMDGLNVATDKDEDSNIWRGDCVEIFLETHSHSYYQFTINPAGALFDLDRKDSKLIMEWASNAEVTAFKGDDYWSVEARIPVAGEAQEQLDPLNGVSGRMPSETYPWYFNVCRQRKRGGETELSAFSPTGERGFNQPLKFGRLRVK